MLRTLTGLQTNASILGFHGTEGFLSLDIIRMLPSAELARKGHPMTMTIPSERTIDNLVASFEHYLRRTRGVGDSTCCVYTRYVRRFLLQVCKNGSIDVPRIQAGDVVEFVLETTVRYHPRSVTLIATALRAFFRFISLEGICAAGLEKAVPTVADWRNATLPRSLSEEQHRRLLASLDDSTPCASRDRAIVLCLSSLGLRAGEVADLRLEDVDWRVGTLSIRRRKNRRSLVLPLPHDAGHAIVAYLRSGRPQTRVRHIFVLHGHRPGAPITRRVVGDVVKRAILRAGISAPTHGAHLLRHTLATRLVNHGASLKEIADVLGHSCRDSTMIYAKVDLATLVDVALPWPEEAS